MDRIWESGASASPPAAPASPSSGYPIAGNPATGTPATTPGPWWYHMVTEEMRAVIAAAGLTPDHTNLGQLLSALQAMGLRDATETLKGRVELATSAEVQAGVDTMRAVTPAGLLAGLLGSGGVGTSDYIMIPIRDKSTGARRNLIVQWVFNSAGATSGTWPIAFPSACLAAVPGAVIEAVNDYTILNVASKSTTGFMAQVYGGVIGAAPQVKSCDYYVVGIGY